MRPDQLVAQALQHPAKYAAHNGWEVFLTEDINGHLREYWRYGPPRGGRRVALNFLPPDLSSPPLETARININTLRSRRRTRWPTEDQYLAPLTFGQLPRNPNGSPRPYATRERDC